MAQESPAAGEFALIARYFAPLAAGFPGAYGLRDDVAVLAPGAGMEFVAKSDAVVAGVHFFPDDPADLVARKALRVNLSDLAAKGAVPRAYLLDLIVPREVTEPWIAAFARGLAEDQAEFGIHLVGGDTDRTPGPTTIAITALGEIAAGRVIRRGGARPGDRIFVTGTIGDGALGLRTLRGETQQLAPALASFLTDRYRLPRPRVAVAPFLPDIATASIDISDGLVADLRHVCSVSGCAAVVAVADVPLSEAARVAIDGRAEWLTTALTGGDDYEILFTAPVSARTRVAELSRRSGVAIAEIGEMIAAPKGGAAVTLLGADGSPVAIDRPGWQHF